MYFHTNPNMAVIDFHVSFFLQHVTVIYILIFKNYN